MCALSKTGKIRVCCWDKPQKYLVLPAREVQLLEREAVALRGRDYDQRCGQERSWGFARSKTASGGRQPRTAERLSSGSIPLGDSPVTPVAGFLEQVHIPELPLSAQYKA